MRAAWPPPLTSCATCSIIRRVELLERLGGDIDPKLGAGERLVDLGVPLDAALDTMDRLRRDTQRIAQTFVRIFLEYIWKPFDDAGRPEADWPQVRAALDQLRPLASEALTATFQPTMTTAVEVAFGKQVDRGRARKS